MRDSAPAAAAREVRTLADVMTLVTLGDSDVRMVALIDVTVVQGEPRTLEVRLPAGYEVTGISGSSLETSEPARRSAHPDRGRIQRRAVISSWSASSGRTTADRSALDTGFVSAARRAARTRRGRRRRRRHARADGRRARRRCIASTCASSIARCSRSHGCRCSRRSAISGPRHDSPAWRSR